MTEKNKPIVEVAEVCRQYKDQLTDFLHDPSIGSNAFLLDNRAASVLERVFADLWKRLAIVAPEFLVYVSSPYRKETLGMIALLDRLENDLRHKAEGENVPGPTPAAISMVPSQPEVPVAKTEQGEGSGGKTLQSEVPRVVEKGEARSSIALETTLQTTRWEKLKKWALNNRFIILLALIGIVVAFLVTLISGLQTLVKWTCCFINWLRQ